MLAVPPHKWERIRRPQPQQQPAFRLPSLAAEAASVGRETSLTTSTVLSCPVYRAMSAWATMPPSSTTGTRRT